jgi:hypothetical protein
MKLSPEVCSTHSQDGAIALDLHAGRMFRLNFVGSRIVELLRSEHTETQIVEIIRSEFSVPTATAAADVREFLQELEKHHLLVTGSEAKTDPFCR